MKDNAQLTDQELDQVSGGYRYKSIYDRETYWENKVWILLLSIDPDDLPPAPSACGAWTLPGG